jgi:hypothetical protein
MTAFSSRWLDSIGTVSEKATDITDSTDNRPISGAAEASVEAESRQKNVSAPELTDTDSHRQSTDNPRVIISSTGGSWFCPCGANVTSSVGWCPFCGYGKLLDFLGAEEISRIHDLRAFQAAGGRESAPP